MKLQRCLTGKLDDNDEKSDCFYIHGDWNGFNESCIGLICENGMFEYRDVYTKQFIRYQIIDNNMNICKTWLHFIFINKNEILFAFENDKNIYKTSYGSDDDIFDIELRFECPDIIKCFDIDLKSERIYCGLSNGDILIGSIDSNKSNISDDEDEEKLILIQNCHSTAITTICGSLLNAFISSGRDQTVNIWDITDNDNIYLLCRFSSICSMEITSIYPFKCYLTSSELLAITTVEGIIYIYLLNEYKLLTILNINIQSEILDISTMNDGMILSVSTLNGYIYLFDTINFNQISFQKLSEKPIIFAKYKKNNNDFLFIDYNGIYKLYPQNRSNTECTEITESIPSIQSIPTPKPKPIKSMNKKKNIFSNKTISSNDHNVPFQTINNRKRNILNPLKNKSILNEKNKENIDPKNKIYGKGEQSSVSKYYKNKIDKIENTKFDIKNIDNDDKKMMENMKKLHLQRMAIEHERRKNMENIYGSLPNIPCKNELISKHFKHFKKINNKNNKQKINNNKYSIEPSIKPFIKRSLQPERPTNFENNTKIKMIENVNMNKTISFKRNIISQFI